MPTLPPELTPLTAALAYAQRGWAVFPVFGAGPDGKCACGSDSCSAMKHPKTKNGCLDASTNPTTISNWWRLDPSANIGIATGTPSGLLVVDFDHEQGVELADSMSSELTPRVITGGGGRHWYMAMPAFPVTNRAHVLPHMDIRSTGGFVVAPPSIHASGNRYVFADGFTPDDADPAPVPQNILDILAAQRNPVLNAELIPDENAFPQKDAEAKYLERALSYVAKMPAAVSGQGGHDSTWMVALRAVHGFGLSKKQAMVVLEDYNKRCTPPWTKAELLHKLDSAIKEARNPAALSLTTTDGTVITPNAGQVPWLETLQTTHTKAGPVPEALESNAIIYIMNDDPPTGMPRLDAFSGKMMVGYGDSLRGLTDHDVNEVLIWLQHESRKLRLGRNGVQTAIEVIAHRNEYHPVRDWLSGLEWDGKPRIETWLIRHGHARDDTYTRAVSSRWLISAVARVMRPGCQADHALILEGPQGSRKSTTVEVLGRPWAAGLSNSALHTKDAMDNLAGKFIIELAELDSMNRSEVSAVKDFLSRRNDFYRPSYGRNAIDHPRQCVFIGSTNETEYLRDPTGGRRFWPVTIHGLIDTNGLAAERDQLFAEAKDKFYNGVPWHLDEAEEKLAQEEQQARTIGDSWEHVIGPWLDGKIIEAGPLLQGEASVSTTEILSEALQIDVAHHGRSEQMRLGPILTRLGWHKKRAFYGKKRQYRYYYGGGEVEA